MPHKSDSNCHEGATLSEFARVSIHTYYTSFFLINTLLVSLLSVFVGILFLQSHRARALSLTTGLVARTQCSHRLDPTSITGQELKPLLKAPQAEATQDQREQRRCGNNFLNEINEKTLKITKKERSLILKFKLLSLER